LRVSPKQRLQLRLSDAGFVLLFLALVGLLMWLSASYPLQFDWTRSGRNSLSDASIAVLDKLDGPVTITAFASERPELRDLIRSLVDRYRAHKRDIELQFVNPDSDPQRTREAGIQYDGELVIEYAGKRQTLRQHNEEQLTNLLLRMGRGHDRKLVFLGGHGERSPTGQANHDYSTWAEQLAKRGSRARQVILAEGGIPKDADLLVIAAPQVALLPGEVQLLRQYVEDGGNLLWFLEPGTLRGLGPLAELLGIETVPGVIVDPTSQAITGRSATFTVVANYPPHPAVKGFSLMTLFPEAAALRLNAREGWHSAVILDSLPSAWAETGKLQETVRFDKDKDIAGPFDLGISLSRKRDDGEQRVAVLGDGDFLSNTYIGNGGNLDLGMNLVDWVARDDDYINVPARSAGDVALNLSPLWLTVIGFGFLLLLPLAFFATGVMIWLRRRKL
jgi:ABC-type uncharacterized transport system involved in gliding motility auxiliary subunit